MCRVEGNEATWTGACVSGLAQGEGVATFPMHYIRTMEGRFQDGQAAGEVKITFRNGGTYEGGWRNGEFHGSGRRMEPWGEGYEGGWIDGYRTGEGVYIAQDGRRIPATWGTSGLVGAWYADPETGCRLWWSPYEQDPVGELRWSGPCVDGKAHGAGTVEWRESDVDRGGRPEPTTESFTGELSDGYVQGAGVLRRRTTYKNAIEDQVFKGAWVDGVAQGYGERTEDRVDTRVESVLSSRTVSRGEWKDRSLSGQGYREETEERRDGGRKVVISEGLFRGGWLNGPGRKEELNIKPDGSRSVDLTEGVFRDGSPEGQAASTYSSGSKNEPLTIQSRIEGDSTAGVLTGFVTYGSDGRFEGEFFGDLSMATPKAGVCDFPEKSFSGKCEIVWRERFLGSGRIACLAPQGKKRPCLIEVFEVSYF